MFGADEQHEVEVDVPRWVRLARLVLDRGTRERALRHRRRDVADVRRRDRRSPSSTSASSAATVRPTCLSFPLDEELPPAGRQPDQGGRGPGAPSDPGDPPTLLGDVIVCPTVAGRQAVEHGMPADDEIALLVVHGVLHLLDYDHAEPEETARCGAASRSCSRVFAKSSARERGVGPWDAAHLQIPFAVYECTRRGR